MVDASADVGPGESLLEYYRGRKKVDHDLVDHEKKRRRLIKRERGVCFTLYLIHSPL